jgi:metal-responsive CopG/Arc/MetJ family transcriptional regulator
MCVAISLPARVVEEVEKRRGFDSRSRYILRAVYRYLGEEEKDDNNKDGVKGSTSVTNQSTPTAPTPKSTEADKIYNLITKEDFAVEE